MLRADLADARALWLKEAKSNPQEYARREESDFLADTNHENELMDFHALRHTCGAWLAQTGAHPKVVQQVMRHQSITLTMDTYGHLFPGQEAEAVVRMREMLNEPDSVPLLATGTDNQAQLLAQQSGVNSVRISAKRCDEGDMTEQPSEAAIHSIIAGLSDILRLDATRRENSGGGTRTPDTRIMIPLL